MWCRFLLLAPIAIAGLFWGLPWTTALPVAVVLGVGTALVVYAGWRAQRRPVATCREAVAGWRGEAVSDVEPEGLVRLQGELWLAAAKQPAAQGQRVEVVAVSGAKLLVRPWS